MGAESRPLGLPWPALEGAGEVLDLSVPRREWLVCPEALVRRLWLAKLAAQAPAHARVVQLGAYPAVRSVAMLEQRSRQDAGPDEPSAASPVVVLLEDGDALLSDHEAALWGLRAQLSEQCHLHLFATSSRAPEGLLDCHAPFLEFFRLHSARQVVPQLEALLPAPEPTAELVHHVLGGGFGARLAVSRAQRLAPTTAPELLLLALDLMSEGLAAQVEVLSPQAQDVFSFVGSQPLAQTGGQVARALGLRAGSVSGQLRRLVDVGMLEDLPLSDEVTGAPQRRVGFRVRSLALAAWAHAQLPPHRQSLRGWITLAAEGMDAPASAVPPELARIHPEGLQDAAQCASWVASLQEEPGRWVQDWRDHPTRLAPWAPALALAWGTANAQGPWSVVVRCVAEWIARGPRDG